MSESEKHASAVTAFQVLLSCTHVFHKVTVANYVVDNLIANFVKM